MSNILIVAAHPDDEVLGCGGTIAKISKENKVQIFILGEGLTSRYDSPGKAEIARVNQLEDKAQTIAKIMGASLVQHDRFPDNRFDEKALLEIVKRVEKVVEAFQPEIIYTHHPGDLNIDHRLTFQAVLTATRPVENYPVKEIYTFEVPSATDWAFQQIQPAFKPNVFVDISNTLEIKIKAMGEYETETRPYPHPRSAEALRAIAHRWGTVVGLEAAEAFELVRSIR